MLSTLAVMLAVVTIIPRAASDPDLLGFRTVCAFVPVSTVLLLGLALFFRMLRDSIDRSPSDGRRMGSDSARAGRRAK
jgi:hypothetical protein